MESYYISAPVCIWEKRETAHISPRKPKCFIKEPNAHSILLTPRQGGRGFFGLLREFHQIDCFEILEAKKKNVQQKAYDLSEDQAGQLRAA